MGDIRIALPSATFTLPKTEAGWRFHAHWGALYRLGT